MAISVRGLDDAMLPRHGTRAHPLPLAIDLSQVEPPPQTLRRQLGYEMAPATQVWGFSTPRHFELRLDRSNTDRYGNNIAVAVVDTADGQRRYEISSSSGVGSWQELPAGRYLLVCSLGVPEELELELVVSARPYRRRIHPLTATARGGGRCRLARGLAITARGGSSSTGALYAAQGPSVAAGLGHGLLTLMGVSSSASRCRCVASSSSSALLSVAPMVWVDAEGRPMWPGVILAALPWEGSALVRGVPWTLQLRLLQAGTTQGRDLRGLTFTAELWRLDRSSCVLQSPVAVSSPEAGGPLLVTFGAEQTRALPMPADGALRLDLYGEDQAPSPRRGYLLTAALPVLDGYSEAA